MNVANLRIAQRRRYSWQDYEQAKRLWAWRNPQATAEQYDQAMREIARRMGL